MRKLPLAQRLHVWWIVLCETRKLAVMATMPIRDIEAYAQKQNAPENIKMETLAAVAELSTGRRPYEAINATIDAIIETKIPGFRASNLV